jgi:hypothetical protein
MFGSFNPNEGEWMKVTCEELADRLKNDADSRVDIIFYRPRYPAVRTFNTHLGAKRYLELRGISEDRITAIDGGRRDTYWMEIWIVPKGATEPKPTPKYLPKKSKKKKSIKLIHSN